VVHPLVLNSDRLFPPPCQRIEEPRGEYAPERGHQQAEGDIDGVGHTEILPRHAPFRFSDASIEPFVPVVFLVHCGGPYCMVTSLPRGTFSGHETFTFRYPWLKKGVDGLRENSGIFTSESAIVELGVGKNMVTSIRHWCLATGMIEESAERGGQSLSLTLSELGRRLLSDSPKGWDPYLEDDATLWLLHWQLVTNPEKATTWYVGFHCLKDSEFTRTTLTEELMRIAAERQHAEEKEKRWPKLSRNTVENDVACFIRTYVPVKRGVTSTLEDTLDCPLTQLGLLQLIPGNTKDKEDRYRFNTRPKPSLPIAIFAFALTEFWGRQAENQNTLSLREIVYGEGSPGRAFRLDEDHVLGYLDRLNEVTKGALSFEDTTLVRQVTRSSNLRPLEILKGYYHRG
jgi:hypothetical protein